MSLYCSKSLHHNLWLYRGLEKGVPVQSSDKDLIGLGCSGGAMLMLSHEVKQRQYVKILLKEVLGRPLLFFSCKSRVRQ